MGTSAEEQARYEQAAKNVPPQVAVRAVKVLSDALDKMGKGTDARIELELALFTLCSRRRPALLNRQPMAARPQGPEVPQQPARAAVCGGGGTGCPGGASCGKSPCAGPGAPWPNRAGQKTGPVGRTGAGGNGRARRTAPKAGAAAPACAGTACGRPAAHLGKGGRFFAQTRAFAGDGRGGPAAFQRKTHGPRRCPGRAGALCPVAAGYCRHAGKRPAFICQFEGDKGLL